MTNPAHNAFHDVHLFDHLAEKHRNRVRQAAQQSDAELIEDAIWHEIPKLVPVPIGTLGEGAPRLTAQAVSEPSPSV